MMWDVVEITEAVANFLRERAQADDLEQAVYSIDAMDELGLHPLIHDALRKAGLGVHPEQRYPAERVSRKKSDGKRCDIVLTPGERALIEPEAEATLFEPADAVSLEGAFWLEIKTVAQHTKEGPFARYSAELLAPVSRDVKKLAEDREIYHAGLMLVLFTADAMTAEHDLGAWEQRVLKRGYPITTPVVRGFDLNDRLGNGRCTVATFAIRRL